MSAIGVTVIAGLLVIPPVAALTRLRPVAAVSLIIGMVCFSAHLLALVYSAGLPAWLVRGLIPVKDWVSLATAITLILSRPHRVRESRWPFVVLLVTVAVGCLVTLIRSSHVSLDALFSSARSLMVAPIGIAIALWLSKGERERVRRYGAVLIAIGAAWGLIEYVLPWSVVTHLFAVGRYWADVKGQRPYLVNIPGVGLLPGNFTTNPYVAGATRRLAGPFGDPLTAGVLCAVGLVWGLASFAKARVLGVLSLISGLALLLTLTRAGWLLAAASIIPMVAAEAFRSFHGSVRKTSVFIGATVTVLAAIVVVLPVTRTYLVSVFSGRNSSTSGHLAALAQLGHHDYTLLGGGVGSAGAVVEMGTESSAITVVLQLGLLGGALYLGACVALLAKRRQHWEPEVVQFLLLLTLLLSWFSSEEWLTYNAGLPTALFVALGGSLARPWRRLDARDLSS